MYVPSPIGFFFPQAVEKMKQEVGEEYPDKSVTIEWMLCDLSSFRSTKDFVTAFKEKNLPLNLLINNAGVAWMPFSEPLVDLIHPGSMIMN